MPIINTRSDLDALKGSPDYAAALQALLGAASHWINVGTPDAPEWQLQTMLAPIAALGVASIDDLLAECATAGIVPTVAEPPLAALVLADLVTLKVAAKARVAARADQIVELITGTVPLSERLSWATKEAAARALVAGTATTVQQSLISAEAQVTGETAAALAASIIANAEAYIVAAGLIAGQRRKTMAALDALVDPVTAEADIAAIFATAETEAQALLASLTA